MANKFSYTITISNNKSENEALELLVKSDVNFIKPDKDSRKKILDLLDIDKKYSRAFDLVLIPGHTNLEKIIEIEDISNIILIELKTTKKKLVNLPYGFFFGATESEFALATQLGNQYKFCFISLHNESSNYVLLTLEELNKIIKTKRIQYQINL
ncbi:hypothetical protein [Flavobacterium sp. KACC 22763]|uniref:hypothetical protein n=1 Tax=Flavobacterium sp. KACC 22763 TaxID=3025668 RepID=UPI00236580D9|nr:hypothetical protein [Flavobacterium sp. KACC 22763]WDF64674.1 hypothetical protein PQ463_00690 [Flavobacterium sp. KACC 22763]